MYSNFKTLPKTNQTSKKKCWTILLWAVYGANNIVRIQARLLVNLEQSDWRLHELCYYLEFQKFSTQRTNI